MALRRAEMRGAPPLAAYGAVWLLTLACLLVVQLARVTEFPPTPFAIVFTGGTLLSAWLSRNPLSEGARFAFGIADGALALLCLIGQSFLNSLLGVGQDNAIESYLSLSFLWYLCLRSTLMVTMNALVFQCVPALALFGLVATYTLATQILWLFVLALLATLFLMLVSHRLEWGGGATSLETNYALRTVLTAGALAGVAAFLLAPLLTLTVGQLIAHFVIGMPFRAQFRPTSPSDMPPELQVGAGAVALSKAEVLRVRLEGAVQPQYLRLESYNIYTGRGWNRGQFWTEPMLKVLEGVFAVRLAESLPSNRTATATVRLSNGWHRNLYLPGVPLEVEASVRQLYYAPPTESVMSVRSLGGGESYVARGYIPPDDPRLLRNAPPLDYDLRSSLNPRRRLPSSNRRPRLQELALALTHNQPTQYDKVMALVRYIEQNTAYNLSAEAYPPEVDVAEYFLFEAKQGYCVEFATALAVLCLHADIPARVASGFILSETDPNTGEYIVREEHRHLWTEVYFAGVGWVAFDATRNASVIEAGAGAQTSAAGGEAQARRRWLQQVLNLLIAATLLTMLYLLAAPRLNGAHSHTRRTAQLYQRLLLALWLLHRERPASGQTPRAYLTQVATALSQRGSAVGARLHALIPSLMTYFYGAPEQRAALEPEIRRQIRQILRQSLQEVGALGLINRLITWAREKLYGR